MKLLERLAKLKQRKQKLHAEPKPGQSKGLSVWHWLFLAYCLALAGGVTLAVYEFFIWPVPPELAGKWDVAEGAQFGGYFRFYRNGTLEILRSNNGKEVFRKARVVVDDKSLLTTATNPKTRLEETNKSTILELTADTLILEFEKGDILKMTRSK
jgi:hypothetical protein